MQSIAFALLRAAALAFLVLLVAFIVLILPSLDDRKDLNWWQNVLFASFAIDLVAIPVLCALNFRFAWRLLRERRMVKRSGLSDLIDSQWKTAGKRRGFVNTLQAIIGVAAALLYLWMLFYLGQLLLSGGANNRFARWELLATLIVYYGILLLTPLFVYLVGRLKQKLELIDGLRHSLLTYQEQATKNASPGIDIPLQSYDLIAQVERAQIERSRAECLRADDTAGIAGSFLLRKSGPVRETLGAMDIRSNLHLQEHIEELKLDPKPKNSSRDEKTGHFLLRLDDVPATIEYSVDDDHRMIEVLAIQNPDADKAPHTDTKA